MFGLVVLLSAAAQYGSGATPPQLACGGTPPQYGSGATPPKIIKEMENKSCITGKIPYNISVTLLTGRPVAFREEESIHG